MRTFDEECTKTLHTKVHQTEQIIRQRMEILNLLAIHLATVRTESVFTIQVIMSALREIRRKAKDLKTEFGIYSKTNQETVERRHTSSSGINYNFLKAFLKYNYITFNCKMMEFHKTRPKNMCQKRNTVYVDVSSHDSAHVK